MSDPAPTAPPGWYPTPDGDQRYWDGEKWLSLPQPGSLGTADSATDSSREEQPSARTKTVKRWPKVVSWATAFVLVAGLAGAFVWKAHLDSVESAELEAEVERAEAEEKKAQEKAEKEERKRQKERDDNVRKYRMEMIGDIEKSIETMAQSHAEEELIDGPVIDVFCDPIGGGSTDILTDQTTLFECFVATTENDDGSMSGYTYSATMNWNTGEYTYRIGSH